MPQTKDAFGMALFLEEKQIHPPAGSTLDEQHVWRAAFIGRLSIHVDPDTWARIVAAANKDIEERRSRGVR